jgi:glycosyltransferase involved in cell wall biosynthesis
MTSSLSVIVPARDAARTLGVTLASVALADRLCDIVVVDDRSSDRTAEVAREANRSLGVPVQLITLEPSVGPVDHHGASAARNAGAAVARGDVLAFVDADDLWSAPSPDPRFAALEAGADIAVGRVQCVREVAGTLEAFGPPFRGFLNGTALIRRDVFVGVGGYEPDLDKGEDLDWYLRARDAGMKIQWVDDVVLTYRLHSGSASALKADRHHGLLVALQRSIVRGAVAPATEVRVPGAAAPVSGESLTVILPVLDAARHLGEALGALEAQTCPPLEVLVVDGGSRDESRQIALRHPSARLIDLPGSGVFEAYNAGLRAARGDLMVFCASDDILSPTALEAHVDAFRRCPTADMSVGLVELFADAGGMSASVPGGLAGTVRRSRVIEASVVRRTVIERYGAFKTDLGTSADIEWIERLASARVEVVNVDSVVVRKRLHRANTSYNQEAGQRDLLRALRVGIDRKRSGP